jgi:phosphoribosylanthranilate isomerase
MAAAAEAAMAQLERMAPGRVRVKVCGVTEPLGARLAAEWGADYLGLNFCEASPRRLDVARAKEIAREARLRAPGMKLVGVFVDRPAAEVAAIDREVGLDLLQFSGDETAADLAPFAPRAIKAFRTAGDPGAALVDGFADCWGVLVDAAHGALRGGTGHRWAYESVAPLARRSRLFLAGGLGPDNVREAIAACRPFAVDVCSRVESAPGIKDPELLRQLFEEVRHGQVTTAS